MNFHSFFHPVLVLRLVLVNSSLESPMVPSLKLMFQQNNSFVVHNPVFMIYGIQVRPIQIMSLTEDYVFFQIIDEGVTRTNVIRTVC